MEFVVEFSAGHFALADEKPRRGVSPLHSAASNLSSYQAAAKNLLQAACRATSVPSDSFAYPRRLDWPLVDTLDELRDVIFEARERLVGLRIPVLIPGTAKLPFEPPRRLCVYLTREVTKDSPFKGRLVRKLEANKTETPMVLPMGSAEAVFLQGYFPARQRAIEWHVCYSVDFARVPEELIPDSFRHRDIEVPLCELPLPAADQFHEFET